MTITQEQPVVLTAEERAESAAFSLHSSELEGLHVSPATREDTEAYVSGEIDSAELLRRVKARYGLA